MINNNADAGPRIERARLLGAYHARRGWGDDKLMHEWRAGLSAHDNLFLYRYEQRGEWGRLDLPSYQPISDPAADMFKNLGVAIAPIDLEAFQQGMQAIGSSFDALRLAIIGVGQGIADGMRSGGEFEKLIAELREGRELAQREDLTEELRYWGIPPGGAQWLAKKWPAYLLPPVIWAWIVDTAQGLGPRIWVGIGDIGYHGAGLAYGLGDRFMELAHWARGR